MEGLGPQVGAGCVSRPWKMGVVGNPEDQRGLKRTEFDSAPDVLIKAFLGNTRYLLEASDHHGPVLMGH